MLLIGDCGAFTATAPAAIVPRGPPAAAVAVATVVDARTVRVNWAAPASVGAITGYRVEAYTKVPPYPDLHCIVIVRAVLIPFLPHYCV